MRRAGADCEPGLVEAIVTDASGEPGVLPLLSTTMRELWELCPSGVLTLDAYKRLGGILDAVARLAERSYSGLDDGERSAVREILLRMASPGEGTSVVRGFVQVDAIEGAGPARRALDRLITDRLVTVDEAHASVAHEALFAHWPRLAAWVAADAEARTMRTRIGDAARSWAEAGQLDTDLLRGPRLSAALDLVHSGRGLLSGEETAFVEASEHAEARARLDLVERLRKQRAANRRLRIFVSVAVVALLVATTAIGLTLHARNTAARAATQSAARGLAAQALTTRRLDVSFLLAAQSAMLDPGVAARSALLAAQAQAPQAMRVFTGTGQRLDTVAVGGPGPLVIAIDRTRHADAFNLATGVTTSIGGDPNGTEAAAFSPDGAVLALGGAARDDPRKGRIDFVDPSTMAGSGASVATPSPVVALRFAGGGRRLAAVMTSGQTDVVDTSSRTVEWTAQGAEDSVRRAPSTSPTTGSTSPPTRRPCCGTLSRACGKRKSLDGDRSAITPDGNLIAIATGTQIRLVHRAGLTPYRVLGSSAAAVQTLAFSPDGQALASGSDDGSAVVWDVVTGQRRYTFAGHDGQVTGVAFSQNGHALVTAATDGRVVTWDLTGKLGLVAAVGSVHDVKPDVMAGSYVALSTATARMLVGTADGRVLITQFPSGRTLSAYTHGAPEPLPMTLRSAGTASSAPPRAATTDSTCGISRWADLMPLVPPSTHRSNPARSPSPPTTRPSPGGMSAAGSPRCPWRVERSCGIANWAIRSIHHRRAAS